MHIIQIFEPHPPMMDWTKANKAKYPVKSKLVLRASQHFYQCIADKNQDPAK